MLKNTAIGWGLVSRILHWSIALCLVAELVIGLRMTTDYGIAMRQHLPISTQYGIANIHHTIGFTVLIAMLGRLIWRLANPVPSALVGQPVLRAASSTAHYLIYGLVIAMPLTGWLALSVYRGFPVFFFGSEFFHLTAERPLMGPYGYGFFAMLHRWGWKILAGLVVLHVVAALWHHFIRRDDVLRRMWRPIRQPNT